MDVLDRMGQQLLPAGCSCFRQLQSTGAEDSAATIDANSIAIIISVAVGMIGYMIQAWSARRADEAAAQLQRRQEMTNAQIVRTSQWIDLCCRPALLGLSEYMTARLRTVVGVAHLVEASQPDEYHRLFGELRVMGPVSEMPDGSTVWSASGKATFELPDRQAVTLATSTHALADFCIGCSKTTHMVSLHDSFNVQVHSHAAELPMGLFSLMSDDLDGRAAASYRQYVRFQLVPTIRSVAKILQEYGHVLELPDLSFMQTKFVRAAKFVLTSSLAQTKAALASSTTTTIHHRHDQHWRTSRAATAAPE